MLTIFTPTYNRDYIIGRVYKSLLAQTNKNFEWIIVDDGSTDNTENLVNGYKKENKMNISYYKQKNQGKPIAHNVGVQEANGDLFTCLDSDDYFTPNAVETIMNKWNEVKENKKCIGIVGMRINQEGKPVKKTYMPNIEYSTLKDLYNKYKYKGDTILIFRREILKKYEFPKIEGEKFIPETYLYYQMDEEGKLAIIQEGIYVCEYLEDGYTKNVRKIIKNNPKGYTLVAKQAMQLSKNVKEKYIAAAKYVLGNILAKEKGYIRNSPKKILTILAIPAAYIVYFRKYRYM